MGRTTTVKSSEAAGDATARFVGTSLGDQTGALQGCLMTMTSGMRCECQFYAANSGLDQSLNRTQFLRFSARGEGAQFARQIVKFLCCSGS
jgi:hypothetical protein